MQNVLQPTHIVSDLSIIFAAKNQNDSERGRYHFHRRKKTADQLNQTGINFTLIAL